MADHSPDATQSPPSRALVAGYRIDADFLLCTGLREVLNLEGAVIPIDLIE